jgi:hypothetical protein
MPLVHIFNLLKPCGNFTYHKVVLTLNFMCFVWSQNNQQLLLYTALTDWFLWLRRGAFTAWYRQSPYIKQIHFVFQGLKYNCTFSAIKLYPLTSRCDQHMQWLKVKHSAIYKWLQNMNMAFQLKMWFSKTIWKFSSILTVITMQANFYEVW